MNPPSVETFEPHVTMLLTREFGPRKHSQAGQAQQEHQAAGPPTADAGRLTIWLRRSNGRRVSLLAQRGGHLVACTDAKRVLLAKQPRGIAPQLGRVAVCEEERVAEGRLVGRGCSVGARRGVRKAGGRHARSSSIGTEGSGWQAASAPLRSSSQALDFNSRRPSPMTSAVK